MLKEIWHDVKVRLIIIVCFVLLLSVALNVVFGFIYFKNGLKIIRNDYITNTSTSNSYASSGALNMNILGQQQYWNGKFELKVKQFTNFDDALKFAKTLNICEWEVAKLTSNNFGIQVWYQDFIVQTDKKEGTPTKTYTERLDK